MSKKIIQCCAGGLYSLAVQRELERCGKNVIRIDANGNMPDCRHVPRHGFVGNIESLVAEMITKKGEPRLVVVLPHNQDECRDLIWAGGQGENWRALVPPKVSFLQTINKARFYTALKECGLGAPEWWPVENAFSDEVLSAVVARERIIKPVEGCGGRAVLRNLDVKGVEYLICDRLIGQEYTVDALAYNGELVDYCTRKRLRAHGGICIDAEVTGRVEKIGAALRDLVSAFSLSGPLAVQCFFDERPGIGVTWTDCNHRFGGGAVLSVAAGWKGIENYCRLLDGEEPITDYELRKIRVRRYYREEVVE